MTEIQRVGDLPSALGLEPLEAAATAQLASGLPKPPVAFPTLGDAEPWKNVSAEPETLRGVLNALGENLSREETAFRPQTKPQDDLPDADVSKPAALPVGDKMPAGEMPAPTTASNSKAPVSEVTPLPQSQTTILLPDAPKGEAPAETPAPAAPALEAPVRPAVTTEPTETKPQVAPQTPLAQPELPKGEMPVAPGGVPVPTQSAEVKPQEAPQATQQVIPQIAPQMPTVQPEAPKGEQPAAPGVSTEMPAVIPAPTPSAEKPQGVPQTAPQVVPQVAPETAPQMPAVQPEAPKGGVVVSADAPVVKDGIAEKPQSPVAAPVTDKAPLAKPEMLAVLPAVAKKETKPLEKDVTIPPAPVQVMAQPIVVEAPVTVAQTAPVVAPQVTQMVAAAEAVTAAISVSQALATTGEGEIHVQLKEDVLDGSSIRLTVKGGDLKVLITPATRAAEETFMKHQEAFQTHLAERVTNWRISVGVSLWGSRAFGNYRSEDEV